MTQACAGYRCWPTWPTSCTTPVSTSRGPLMPSSSKWSPISGGSSARCCGEPRCCWEYSGLRSPVKQIQPLNDDTCVRRIHKDVPVPFFLPTFFRTFLWFLMCAGQSLMSSNGCFVNGFILTLYGCFVLDARDVTWVTLLVDIVYVWIWTLRTK